MTEADSVIQCSDGTYWYLVPHRDSSDETWERKTRPAPPPTNTSDHDKETTL